VTAANLAGFREYVHVPSLVEHTGIMSSMDNGHWTQKAVEFPGEDFDCMELFRR
jgi:hypothetical protein